MLRLALAGIAGFILGIISNGKDKTKSSRVFAIVSISSALLYIVATGIYQQAPGVGDPTRLTAQILSALGFLFAGIVWVSRDKRVEGTNTAAALLMAALIGLLIGAGRQQTTLLGIFFFMMIYWLSGWVKSGVRRKRMHKDTGE